MSPQEEDQQQWQQDLYVALCNKRCVHLVHVVGEVQEPLHGANGGWRDTVAGACTLVGVLARQLGVWGREVGAGPGQHTNGHPSWSRSLLVTNVNTEETKNQLEIRKLFL